MTIATSITPPLRSTHHERGRGVLALMYLALALVIAILGFAAVMKLTSDEPDKSVAVAIAVLELAFIGALVAFRKRWWAWLIAVALFGAFAGYTGFLLYRGAESCGCFGDVETPPLMTLGIDLFMFTLSGVVALAPARRVALLGAVITIGGFGRALGAGVSVLSADPLPSDFKGDRAALLLASPALEEVAATDLSGPDWLVYIYDAKASESPMLDKVQEYAAANPNDDSLRVLILTAQEAEQVAAVPAWSWDSLPQAMLFRGGRVVQRYLKQAWTAPAEIRSSRPVGPIAQVLALPEYADIAYATGDLPVYILYVYNIDCPICIEHLVTLETFMDEFPNDPHVAIVPIPMQDLEKDHDIPMWSWPGVPTSYVVRGGRVLVQTATPQTVPNPYQIRMDVSMGKSLVLPPATETEGHEGHGH